MDNAANQLLLFASAEMALLGFGNLNGTTDSVTRGSKPSLESNNSIFPRFVA
jgi:hypothetical protein